MFSITILMPYKQATPFTDTPLVTAKFPTASGNHSRGAGTYPLVNIQKAIENGHRNSEFSH